MGTAIALLCVAAIPYGGRFLADTTKGRRLVRWLGEARAVIVWRSCLTIGIAFGCALALGIVNPLTWE